MSARRKWTEQKRLEHQRQNHRAGNHAGVELVHLDVLFDVGVDFHSCHRPSGDVAAKLII